MHSSSRFTCRSGTSPTLRATVMGAPIAWSQAAHGGHYRLVRSNHGTALAVHLGTTVGASLPLRLPIYLVGLRRSLVRFRASSGGADAPSATVPWLTVSQPACVCLHCLTLEGVGTRSSLAQMFLGAVSGDA